MSKNDVPRVPYVYPVRVLHLFTSTHASELRIYHNDAQTCVQTALHAVLLSFL